MGAGEAPVKGGEMPDVSKVEPTGCVDGRSMWRQKWGGSKIILRLLG